MYRDDVSPPFAMDPVYGLVGGVPLRLDNGFVAWNTATSRLLHNLRFLMHTVVGVNH